jgi:hypothetical protein
MSPLTYTLLAQVGSGRIQGGWEYIWSAYGIAWASLSLYALSLWVRRPKANAVSKE